MPLTIRVLSLHVVIIKEPKGAPAPGKTLVARPCIKLHVVCSVSQMSASRATSQGTCRHAVTPLHHSGEYRGKFNTCFVYGMELRACRGPMAGP